MKGLKVERARPSNAIDIYSLLAEGAKDGSLSNKPSQRQLRTYYFNGLIHQLAAPGHLWFIARRGRGFIGFLHAILLPSPWDGQIEKIGINLVFVAKKRRKMGVGRKLIEELKKEAENMGIKRLEFSCPIEQSSEWEKLGAAASQVQMGVDL